MAEYVVEFGKDGGRVEPDGRLDAPAFHRNHQAIRAVLQRYLADQSGDVIEAGSGTGQHVVDFARHFPEHRVVAERSQRGASEKHRGVAGACGIGEYPPAAADRPVGSGMVSPNCATAAAPACWRCSAPM